MIKPFFYLITAFCITSQAQAATISWNVFNIANDITQISTTGTLHNSAMGTQPGATNGVDGTFETYNGVNFFDNSTLSTFTNQDNISSRAGSYSGANAPYRNLLEHGSRNNTNADTPINFTGLTIGNTYQIQIWAADNINTAQTLGMVLGDGTGSAPTHGVDSTLLYENGAEGSYGQYGIGTFVADASSQTLLVRRWVNLTTTPAASGTGYINAWQIRDLGVVPEPSSALLGGLGALLLLRRRRD